MASLVAVGLLAAGCSTIGSPAGPPSAASRSQDVTATAPDRDADGAGNEQTPAALAAVRAGDAPVTGLVVRQRGEVTAEAYGPDSGPDVRQPVWSITKSVVSALVGLAVADGHLRVDTPLVDVVGPVAAGHPRLTIEHLLTMTSGLDLPDGDATFGALYAADDWVAHVLAQPATAAPGTRFAYCSACVHLLTAAVDVTTGDAAALARQRLFAPLGIEDPPWSRATDGSGVPIGGWGLELTTRELARFGQLHLDRGVVDGQQVVPADWVATATRPHVDVPDPFEGWQRGYGFLWWVGPAGAYAATGRGGQLVLALPDHDVVVAATADLPDAAAADAAAFVWNRVVGPLTGTP